jgi:hypothetical protein
MIDNLTSADMRVLVHLSKFRMPEDKREAPWEVTRPGIYDAIGPGRRSTLHRRLPLMAAAGLVEEERVRLFAIPRERWKGNNNLYFVYNLTPDGRKLAKVIKEVWPQ